MFREEVPAGTGMIFLFDRPAERSFWMKNCKVPLDIAWLDDDLAVVHLAESVPPCAGDPCPSYGTPVPARYVVEVAGGTARGLGLAPGGRVVIASVEGGT